MALLILESLGSTELLFILVMALVFFGPRKLPQISRTLGKNLAEFRRASEDFKATWDREVSLEEFNPIDNTIDRALPATDNSIMERETSIRPLQAPAIETRAPERVIPHEPMKSDALDSSDGTDSETATDQVEPSRKRDWL